MLAELVSLSFFLLLCVCAYHDYFHKKRVPDIYVAGLWACMLFSSNLSYLAGMTFAVVYLVNAAYSAIGGKQILGWMDILGIPPFMAVMVSFGGFGVWLACLAILYPMGVSVIKKKEIPVYPFFLAFYLIAMLLSVV